MGPEQRANYSLEDERRVRRPREGRDYAWTCEMPNLRRTARRRRTAAAAHEGSRPARRAALRRPLSALWRVRSSRRCDGEGDGVPRVGLPRARTSAERSLPCTVCAPQSARLARPPRLSAVDEVSLNPPRFSAHPPTIHRLWKPCPVCQSLMAPSSSQAATTLLSGQAERLERRGLRVTEEDRVDMLHDVAGHFEEVPLVLQGNKRATRAVVHCDL